MSREEVPKMGLPQMKSRGRFRAVCSHEVPTELVYVGCPFQFILFLMVIPITNSDSLAVKLTTGSKIVRTRYVSV